MNIKSEELTRHLSPLKQVYIVSGDEPLGVQEALDKVRAAAKEQGYLDRKIFDVNGQFNWSEFTNEWQSMSLFAEKKIIDLRFVKDTVPNDGKKALADFAQSPPEETILLMSFPKLDRQKASAKWFMSLTKLGVFVQIWPVDIERLPQWIQQRAKKLGISISQDAADLLSERVSGNLLAATQELEKLKLSGIDEINQTDIEHSAGDSAKFNIFQLMEFCLLGDLQKVSRIFDHLLQEGTETILILKMLARETRMLIQLSQTHNIAATFKELRIWEKRQGGYRAALKRLSIQELYAIHKELNELDKAMKTGDPMFKTKLRAVSLRLAGFNPMPMLQL